MSIQQSQPRVPVGVPAGGEWTNRRRSESPVSLVAPGPGGVTERQRHQRKELLLNSSYVPATAGTPTGRGIGETELESWWGSHFVRGEHVADGSGYAKMPDDWTPNRTGGQSLSGHRRTHRRTYEGAGVKLRMPSATSIKSFSASISDRTFDLPVTADFPGGSVEGSVRVTRRGPNEYAVSGNGFDAKQQAYVCEAVSAVLEARRPTVALAEARDLLRRRRERFAASGAKMHNISDRSFISAVGYNKYSSMMGIQIGNRSYAYEVPEIVYRELAEARSPGSVYNLLVKGRGNLSVSLKACAKCGRHYRADEEHRCPSKHYPADKHPKAQNSAQLRAARRERV